MTTITLEVPDELAGRLAPLKAQLPQLLAFTVDLFGIPGDRADAVNFSFPVFSEVIEFLAQGPSHQAIINFKVSAKVQSRLEELLDKGREGKLLPQEQAELNTFQQINHLLILLKARARTAAATAN